MLQIVAGAALGALATLVVTWWLNRNTASRTARRDTYVDLLTTLKAALRIQEMAVFDHTTSIPDTIRNERIDPLRSTSTGCSGTDLISSGAWTRN